MKKIIYKSMLLLALILAIGCTKEDNYEPPYGDYSSFQWYSSNDWDNDTKVLNINDYVSFFDLSRNSISNKWTTPANTFFLNKEFTNNDSIYDKFITGPGGETGEKLINVLFKEPGVHEVRLFNVFKDEVEGSQQAGDSWYVEKVFTIDVFADPNPAGKIFYNDVEVFSFSESDNPSIENKASWPVLEIEAAEKLVYVDESTVGRVTGRKWTFEGGKPETSSAESATVAYNKLGEFTSILESVRTGSDVPTKRIQKHIPLRIKVNPSTKPFQFNGGLNMTPSGLISFAVTGEANTIVGQESKFTVHVTNTAAGFDADIPVQSATVKSGDATIVELTLAAPVYNSDKITVAYAGGNITSVDGRNLLDFAASPVKIDLGASVLVNSWASYENPRSSGNQTRKADAEGYWVGASNDALKPFWRVEDKSFDGIASMRYMNPNGIEDLTLQGSDFSKPNGVAAGTYYVSYRVYLEVGNTMKGFSNAIQDPFQLITWDLESLPRGEWVEIGQVVTTGDISSGRRFDLKIDASENPGVTGEQIMYFDNLKWVPLNPRP